MPTIAAVEREDEEPAPLLLLWGALVLVGSVGVVGEGRRDGVAVSRVVPGLLPAVGSAMPVVLVVIGSVENEVRAVVVLVRRVVVNVTTLVCPVVDEDVGSSGCFASSGQPPRSQAGWEQQPRNPLAQFKKTYPVSHVPDILAGLGKKLC